MLETGAEIEGYRIERLLGRGGMGEVYEATQLGLGRRVAFKVLHVGLGEDEAFRERFRREGELQATLEHPNVVTVYEAGEIDEGLFLAMRLVDGVTLKQLIVVDELGAERALGILASVADALDAAHARGLVHRDVKPQNILVGEGDHPFLADFGLTRGRDQIGFTRSGQVMGTIDYISPEQVRGEPASAASDVYAFGGVLYECLTGSVPYARPSDAAVLYAHVSDSPPSVSAIRDDLPKSLDAVVSRGMAKEPDDRPASAGELVAAAKTAIGSGAAAMSRPPQRTPLDHGVRPVSGDTEGVAAGEGTEAGGPTTATASIAIPRSAKTPLIGIAALAALALAAFLGGRAVSSDQPSKLTTSVSSEALSLSAPGTWKSASADERAAVPGLRLRDAVGVAPITPDGSGVSAGTTGAQGPLLLPATLVDRVAGGLPRPAPVRLGKLEALRYRGVDLPGFGRSLTLYASPSTAGVATVACYSPGKGDGFEGTCESIAQTLELTAGHPYSLAASPQAKRALQRTIASLSAAGQTGRRRLARAADDDAQAAAAEQLAQSYAAAARQLARVKLSPEIAGRVDAIRAAISDSEGAYRTMASSARSGDPQGYAAAGKRLAAAEASLARALTALGREPERGEAQ